LFDIASRVFDGIKRAIEPLIATFGDLFGGISEGVDPVKLFQDVLTILTTVMTETGKIVGELAGFVIELVVTGIQFAIAAVNSLVSLFVDQNKETKALGTTTEKTISPLEAIKNLKNENYATSAKNAVTVAESNFGDNAPVVDNPVML